jgi:hypothetical protein
MINVAASLFLIINFLAFASHTAYAETEAKEKLSTTIALKHISGDDIISVLKSLVDKSVLISTKNNSLIIKGTADKTNTISHIVKQVDTPATALTIKFIASSRKLDLNNSNNSFQSKNNTSQSMSIIERQWVTLNTGLSIPVTERKRYADGTETQSYRFKKITKSYVFKAHEFSGWSIIQVGLNDASLNNSIEDAIEYTQLDTTIVGKTGEWLEVTSNQPVTEEGSTQPDPKNKHAIYLYVKIMKSKIKTDTKNSQTTETNQ